VVGIATPREGRTFAELLIDCEEGSRRVLLNSALRAAPTVEATDTQNRIKHLMVAIVRQAARQSIGAEA
jgi:hypothetical protein